MIDPEYKQRRIAGVDHSPGRSIIEFMKVSGKWWFSIWVLVVLAGLVALGLTITAASQLPPMLWISLFGVGFLVAPIVAFHFVRVERDTYYALWHDKETLLNVLTSMEELRKEAAPLQIRGKNLKSARLVNKWIKEVTDWTERAINTVKLLHPAEAGNLKTLGVFDVEFATGTKPFNSKHASTIRNLIRRMAILADIRDRWTTRNNP